MKAHVHSALAVAALSMLPGVVQAAVFDVDNPTEFQTALTTAQANGEADTINVSAGTYNVAATLTYTAAATENFPLTIDGFDSDTRTLDGGMLVPILRIDTTAVTDDDGIAITVSNMTFDNGNAVGTPSDGGALAIVMDEAVFPTGVSIAVSGSEFYDNAADGNGGALFIRGNAGEGISLTDLTFETNVARGIVAGAGDGGAVHVEGGTAADIFVADVDFFGNRAAADGGAINIEGDLGFQAKSANFFDILFLDNQITAAGGNGGGANINAVDFNVEKCGFVDNVATGDGGGFYLAGVTRNGTVNSGFVGNQATNGGGIATDDAFDSGITITNNTFTGNTASGDGGGILLSRNGSTLELHIISNIIWGNMAEGRGADLYIDDDPASMPVFVPRVLLFNNDFSDFETKCQTDPSCTEEIDAQDNIDSDPLLVDVSARPEPDPHLMAASPAIDTGLNAPDVILGIIYRIPGIDFEDDARPFDGNNDSVATIDIGMDEFIGMATPNADIAVTKTDSPDPVTEGGNVTYTVTVSNNGPGDATMVMLTDTLDELVSFVSATPSQGTCIETSGTLSCDLGAIAASGSATVTIEVLTPDVAMPTTISNMASVSAAEPDSDDTNDSVIEDTTVVPAGPAMADLALTKTDAPDPVFSGGQDITYTLTATNNGPDDATAVMLTDTLPVEAVFVSANSPDGTCAQMSGVVDCDLGSLVVDASAVVTIVVSPNEVTEPTDIANIANVRADEEDPVPENNSISESTTINAPSSDLTVGVASSPSEPLIDTEITYTLTTNNNGPSDDTNVVLTAVLPAQATFVSASTGCTETGGTVTCDLGDLGNGDSVTTMIVITGPSVSADLILTIDVSGDKADPITTNNIAASQISVIDAIDLIVEGVGTGAVSMIEVLLGMLAVAWIGLRRRGVTAVAVLAPVALCLGLAATDVAAQPSWYAGASAGRADLDYDSGDLVGDLAARGWAITTPSVKNDDTGWKIYGGVEFGQVWGVEAAWVDLGEVTTRFGASIPPPDIDDLLRDTAEVHGYMASGLAATGVARIALSDNWQAFAKAGLFTWESEADVKVVSGASGSAGVDDSGTDLTWGVGVKAEFQPGWRVRGEWERFELDDPVDLISVGVEFSF